MSDFIEGHFFDGRHVSPNVSYLRPDTVAKLVIADTFGSPSKLYLAVLNSGRRFALAEVDWRRLARPHEVRDEPNKLGLIRVDLSDRDGARFECVPLAGWRGAKPIGASRPLSDFDEMADSHVDLAECVEAILCENGSVIVPDPSWIPWARDGVAESFDSLDAFLNVARILHSMRHHAPERAARLGRRIKASRGGDESADRFDLSKLGA